MINISRNFPHPYNFERWERLWTLQVQAFGQTNHHQRGETS